MEHKYETYIKCPYCNYEDEDSWEFDEDEGTYTCRSCEEEFNVTRDIEVTYSTSVLSCTQKGEEHKFELDHVFVSNKTYKKGQWIELPEEEHTHYKIMKCCICTEIKPIIITKEEYYESNKI